MRKLNKMALLGYGYPEATVDVILDLVELSLDKETTILLLLDNYTPPKLAEEAYIKGAVCILGSFRPLNPLETQVGYITEPYIQYKYLAKDGSGWDWVKSEKFCIPEVYEEDCISEGSCSVGEWQLGSLELTALQTVETPKAVIGDSVSLKTKKGLIDATVAIVETNSLIIECQGVMARVVLDSDGSYILSRNNQWVVELKEVVDLSQFIFE